MGLALGIASVLTGAVGAGIQYASASSAARAQEQLALLNAEAQTQAIAQQGEIGQMQAAINGQLALNDRKSAENNARMLADRAGADSATARAAIRLSRAESAKIFAAQRTAFARGNLVDTNASPLAALADENSKAQKRAESLLAEDSQHSSDLLLQASIQKNQALLAGLNVTGQRIEGLAAAQKAASAAAQAKLTLYEQRASAAAMRTEAGGRLFSQFGSLAGNAWSIWNNTPKKTTQYGISSTT